jgi:hypothetical protein
VYLFFQGGGMTSRHEQEWFKKFYEGTFLVKGWKTQMRELLQDFQGNEKDAINDLLNNLGEKIGREWAKDNAVRRIDTAKLQQWGASLTNARKKGKDVLAEEIRIIDATVDEMLS